MATAGTTAGSVADPKADQELAAALGLTAPGAPDEDPSDEAGADEQDQDVDDEQDSDDPVEFEDLPQSWQDEIKRLRAESAGRRTELRAKDKEIRDLRAGKTQTPAEELAAAREEGRNEAKRENAEALAGAEVKAALKGVVADDRLNEYVEDLNLGKFVTEDNEVDADAVKALQDRVTSLLGTTRRKSTPKADHGRASGGAVKGSKSNADQFAEALNLL